MLRVRAVTPADAGAVVRVHIRTWQDAYAGIVPDDVLAALDGQVDDRVRRARERWAAADSPFRTVVAEDGGSVLGFASFGPYRRAQAATDLDPETGEVLAIYVDPARQGRGAGRALLDHAVEALRAAGAGEIRLWVLERNAPSRRFYERYGFVADGERHFFRVERPDGVPVDLPEVRYTLPVP